MTARAETVEDWFCFFDHSKMGSGWRLAHVTVGRKWVQIRLHAGKCHVLKISKKEWDEFPKRAVLKDAEHGTKISSDDVESHG